MEARRGLAERLVESLFRRVSDSRGQLLLRAFLRSAPGRWLLAVAHRILPARQPIGVLAVVVDAEGPVLLVDHVTRAEHPLGLPGGWLARAERPEDGLRRELHEELGLRVTSARYLLSAPHRNGTGRPYGLTLVFRAEVDATPATAASGEVAGLEWRTPAEALAHLRDFEAEAVRIASTAPLERTGLTETPA